MGTIIPRFHHYALLTPFYTRVFKGTRDSGMVTELYAWMVLLFVILNYGMKTTFFRFVQKEVDPERVYSTALISVFITSVLFILLLNIFISFVSALMNYKNKDGYIRLYVGIVAIDAFTAILFAKIREVKKFLLFGLIKLAYVILTLGVVIFLLQSASAIYE